MYPLDLSTSAFTRAFGSRGRGSGQFESPCAITADVLGNLLVLDNGTNRLQAFSAAGEWICTLDIPGLDTTAQKGIAWKTEGGCLVIANGNGNNALIFGDASAADA
jgi:hypothetical protein